MTGPEHYRAAEHAMDHAENEARLGHDFSEAMALANAQVHATLALAAATALSDGAHGASNQVYAAWAEVASVTS